MDTPSLFDSPPAQRHSRTSQDAAAHIEPASATLRRAVLDWLRGRGAAGSTDEEGIDATAISPSTYRPRRVELWRLSLVRDSGQTRATRSGRRAVVWVAAEHALPPAPG